MARRPDITQRFGNRVRELRQRAGFSQEEFAAQCDLDRTYISGIERGTETSAYFCGAGHQAEISTAGRRTFTGRVLQAFSQLIAGILFGFWVNLAISK